MSLGTVVYSGTRNLYEQMYVSLKSVLLNTPNIKAYYARDISRKWIRSTMRQCLLNQQTK